MKTKLQALIGLLFLVIVASGCGEKSYGSEYEIELVKYEGKMINTVEATDESIYPVKTLKLQAENNEIVTYYTPKDDMTVQSVNCNEGDLVEEGQVLITLAFENETVNVKQYQDKLEEDRLLLEHYKKLMELGYEGCSEDDIKLIENDISINECYIAEEQEKAEACKVVAQGRGVVIKNAASKYLSANSNGAKITVVDSAGEDAHVIGSENVVGGVSMSKNMELITVSYGDGIYTTIVDDEYGLELNKTYTAYEATVPYDVKLIKIEDYSEEGKLGQKKLTFEYIAVANTMPNRDTLDMVLELEPIQGAVHIPEQCVKEYEGYNYVVVLSENGYCVKRAIKVSGYSDNEAIIESGLSVGEKVFIR